VGVLYWAMVGNKKQKGIIFIYIIFVGYVTMMYQLHSSCGIKTEGGKEESCHGLIQGFALALTQKQ
jgi:hypothetical protein